VVRAAIEDATGPASFFAALPASKEHKKQKLMSSIDWSKVLMSPKHCFSANKIHFFER
jgi:hypothetical protein